MGSSENQARTMQNKEEKIMSVSAKTAYGMLAVLLIAMLVYGLAQWR
jgi:cytochrome b561